MGLDAGFVTKEVALGAWRTADVRAKSHPERLQFCFLFVCKLFYEGVSNFDSIESRDKFGRIWKERLCRAFNRHLSGGNRQKTSGCPMTQPSFQSGVFDVQSYRYSSPFGAWSYQRT